MRPVDYVNPLIGTGGDGFTFPGAIVPWGMVSPGPHTTYVSPWGYLFNRKLTPAGYYYGEPKIDGFGLTHLSGVACNELGAPLIAVNLHKLTPGKYASSYRNQIAKAGFYSVDLEDVKTKVYITATQRCACFRFKFMVSETYFIILDAFKNLSWTKKKGYIKKINDETFCGWSQTGNFCYQRKNKQRVYFYLKALKKPNNSGLWKFKRVIDSNTGVENVGAWLSYTNKQTVDIVIGISYTSIENAKQNLEYEIGNKEFETVLGEATEKWESVLEKVLISDKGKDSEKEIFYTALYHALIHPNIVNDVNGDYPLYESSGIGNKKTGARYGLFSLWDTYRTVHPLLSLLYPEQQQDMLYTLEDMTLSAGHPPRWELYGSEINLMVGDPGMNVLSEGVVKGFKLNHPEQLFKVLYNIATDPKNSWRPGNKEYLKYGYIPEKTKGVWGSVSTTLEYSYSDWALSRFARKIGYYKESEKLLKQSYRWRTLFDKELQLLRPKDIHGKWKEPFNPAATDESWIISLFIKGHGGPGFVEGNAYQYTFMIPHDIEGLIDLFGSREAFINKLKEVFENGYFTVSNEHDLLYPYLLNVEPSQTIYMQCILQKTRSNNFTNKPDGLPGNDDAGTISSWYVFTALGLYPVNPASGNYMVGVPLFNNVSIKLQNSNKTLKIIADFDTRTEHWNSLSFNNKTLLKRSISYEELMKGGVLKFIK